MNKKEYLEFKQEMARRGHSVHKKGKYVTIEPHNGVKGFQTVMEVINGYEEYLIPYKWEHFNTTIYWVKCKIADE